MQPVRGGLLARSGSGIGAARGRDGSLQARDLRGPVRIFYEMPLLLLELVDRVGGRERFNLFQCLDTGSRRLLRPCPDRTKREDGQQQGYAHLKAASFANDDA